MVGKDGGKVKPNITVPMWSSCRVSPNARVTANPHVCCTAVTHPLCDVFGSIHVFSQAKPLKKPKKAAGELDEDDKAFLEKKKAEQVPPQDTAYTVHRARSRLWTKDRRSAASDSFRVRLPCRLRLSS